jgi:putative hydrolase of the HAD superfamily
VTVRVILLDALGTLVRLEPPAPRLRAELARLAGVDVGAEAAERAFRAEIEYYLAHHLEGRDARTLDSLRDRCALVVQQALGQGAPDVGTVREAMLGSLEFTPFPDTTPALRRLRDLGLPLVVASNWDCSLAQVLESAGLGGLVDGVVSSAVAGRAKPAPDVFLEALRLVGAEAGEALHVGDSMENDVEGARAAGMRAVLLRRDGGSPPGIDTVRSLDEVAALT